MTKYGEEVLIDLHGCSVDVMTRDTIRQFLLDLCDRIEMERCELYFWDDLETPENEKQTSPHTQGTSAVQFILTSNITIHTLEQLGKVFINVFSCKPFSQTTVEEVVVNHFGGEIQKSIKVDRL